MRHINIVLCLAALSGCADPIGTEWIDIPVDTDSYDEPENDYTHPETPPQGVPESTVVTRATASVISELGYTTLGNNEWMQFFGQTDYIFRMLDLEFCAVDEDLYFMQLGVELRGDTDGDTEYMNNNIPADQWVTGCYGWTDNNMVTYGSDSYFVATMQLMSEDGHMYLDLEDYDPTIDHEALWGVKITQGSCRTVHLSCSFKDIPAATGNPDVWSLGVYQVTAQQRNDYTVEAMLKPAEIEQSDPDGLNLNAETYIMTF